VGALVDADPYVRATAFGALASRATASEAPATLESYRRALADSGSDARVAAIGFLGSAWESDSTRSSDSLTTAVRGLRPPAVADDLVRAIARDITPLVHRERPATSRRSIHWYERVVRTVLIPTLAAFPPVAQIVTERGAITPEMYGEEGPLTAQNFLALSRRAFCRGARFDRVVPGFVVQDGDSRGDGTGGPGYTIRDELNRRRCDRGTVGMALSGPDTGASQYFVTLAPQPHLDGHYTVFARVTADFDVLGALVQGDRILEVKVQ